MSVIAPTLPNPGDPRGGEETDVRNALVAILADHNGNINNDNLAAGAAIAWSKLANGALVLDQVGANGDAVVRRGKSIIATEETRSNTAYGTLTTPDQVANVVLPTDGFICVAYQALWKTSAGTGAAALFLGSNQVKARVPNSAAPVTTAARHIVNGSYAGLVSSPVGLVGIMTPVEFTSDVTTGQVLGGLTSGATGWQGTMSAPDSITSFSIPGTGPTGAESAYAGGECKVFAAAGTYTISVQFKVTSGSISAKERKLWVWTVGF